MVSRPHAGRLRLVLKKVGRVLLAAILAIAFAAAGATWVARLPLPIWLAMLLALALALALWLGSTRLRWAAVWFAVGSVTGGVLLHLLLSDLNESMGRFESFG